MNIFISWSDKRSKHIAEALRSWLPKVLQSVKPWLSEEDISAGSKWATEVAAALTTSQIGLIVVTPENQHNPWLQFEAGALSKTIDDVTCVCPLLFDMSLGQLSGPLTQFQAMQLDKSGLLKVLLTINGKLENNKMDTKEIEEILDVWWPKFMERIELTPSIENKPEVRAVGEQLEEILQLSREQLRRENLRLEKTLEKDERMDKMLDVFESMSKQFHSKRSNINSLFEQISKNKLSESEMIVESEDLSSALAMFPDISGIADDLRKMKLDQKTFVAELINNSPEKK